MIPILAYCTLVSVLRNGCRTRKININNDIKDGEISGAERVQVFHGAPYCNRRQGLVRSHALGQTTSFGDQETEISDKISLAGINCLFLPSSESLPVSAVLGPIFLVPSERRML